MSISSISVSSGSIPSSENLPIRYDLYTPITGNSLPVPVIIFLHGFKGFKDWGPFPDAFEELARAGFAVVAMNFSLNGIGAQKTEFTELDLFARQTFSQDLDDVGRVVDALQKEGIQDKKTPLNTDKIGIIGHSRGGHTAIAAAATHESIACLVTWAAVADYRQRWTESMKQDWENKGFTEIMNSRTGQSMPVNRIVYDDLAQNADQLVPLLLMPKLQVPSLFIHGRDDETVPYTESEELHIACKSPEKELRLISKTGHTYGAAHPFEEPDFPEAFAEVLQWTEGWFLEYLR